MEIAYSYDLKDSEAMNKMMDEEFFKRLGPTIRDCKIMGLKTEGMCIYIKARDELVEEAKKLLVGSPAKLLTGDEGDAALRAFRDESDAAEGGMGAMFG